MFTFNENLKFQVEKYTTRFPHNHKKVVIKLMWWELKSLFSNQFHGDNRSSFTDEKIHIGLLPRGGIGDLLHAVRYVFALERYLENTAEVDIISETKQVDILRYFFPTKKVTDEKKLMSDYDIFIELIRFPDVKSVDFPRLNDKARSYVGLLTNFKKKNADLFKNDFLATCYAKNTGHHRCDMSDIDGVLDLPSVDYEPSVAADIDALSKKYGFPTENFVTVQTGQGALSAQIENEVRQWRVEYYDDLVEKLKKNYPHSTVVQVGEPRQNKISKADIDLRGKTTMDGLFCLLKHARLHISQEGGPVIMRHYLKGGASVVLCGPTDSDFFGFPENLNLSRRTCPVACEWLCKDWLKSCMAFGKEAKCMNDLTPDFVMKEIERKGILHE